MDSARNVVIIGAPRSGTNMLRNLLCSVDGVATWPCDEINYIWRHGNVRYPSDAFTADMAKPWIQDYIRKKFRWVAQSHNAHTVVEKTCANSLRVAFVDQILDEPQYVFIYRNGVDAIGSAMKRWRAKLDLPYVLSKARFVPPADLPYYALRYIGSRLSRLGSSDDRLSTWGPVLPDMSSLKSPYELADLCALQWQVCVERSLDAFEDIPRARVLHVAYEVLVKDTTAQASRVASFLGFGEEAFTNSADLRKISADSVGKAYAQMTPDAIARISCQIEPSMQRLGYQ